MKILIAPNSFKECIEAPELASLIKTKLEKLLKEKVKNIKYYLRPISDGGDGFLKVIASILDIKIINITVPAPFPGSDFAAPIGYDSKKKSIYIESAEILGLKKIPKEKRDPLKLSSKGMGELLLKIAELAKNDFEIENVYIGIGGTGSVDFGMGMMQKLGLKFFNAEEKLISEIAPEKFLDVYDIASEKIFLPFKINIALDVDNPLIGEDGASRVFAPQKGADPQSVERLEEGIGHLKKIILKKFPEFNQKFFSGAGGGLGTPLHLFYNGQYTSAKEFVIKFLGVDRNLKPDVIITGEGSYDSQSIENKGIAAILHEFKETDSKILIIAGNAQDIKLNDFPSNVRITELIDFFSSREESMEKIEEGIDLALKENLDFFSQKN